MEHGTRSRDPGITYNASNAPYLNPNMTELNVYRHDNIVNSDNYFIKPRSCDFP